jgi:hypothetical protein
MNVTEKATIRTDLQAVQFLYTFESQGKLRDLSLGMKWDDACKRSFYGLTDFFRSHALKTIARETGTPQQDIHIIVS